MLRFLKNSNRTASSKIPSDEAASQGCRQTVTEDKGGNRNRRTPILTAVTAFAAGLLNGFLGTGGGAVLVLFLPALTGLSKYRSALAAMLALTGISAGWFFTKHPALFSSASPYLFPAFLGGGCGALLLGKFGASLADRLFAVLTVIAGGILLLRG